MKKNKIILFACLSLIVIFALSQVSAESNESIQAQKLILNAETCLSQIIDLNIPSARANSSLTDAEQLYSAQLALEAQKRQANYKLVNQEAADVCSVKDLAIKADEELKAFLEAYNEAAKSVNLSEMDSQYANIINSFNDSRFEDTLTLIDRGYVSVSDIQSKQTALRLFYDTTSRTLKKFFIDNWKNILVIIIVVVVLLFVFWRAINRALITTKIRHLQAQKASLNSLIKELQRDYFSLGKISESEFNVKLATYKDMMLEIERQVPLLEEELAKAGGKRIYLLGIQRPKKETRVVYTPSPREIKSEEKSVVGKFKITKKRLSKKNKKGYLHR